MDQLEYRLKVPFLQVQNALIDDTEHFDKFEKWVWIVLARHAFGGLAYPSQKTIADKVGISDRKVRECLVSLQTKGWITKAGINEKTQTVKWLVDVPDEIQIKWLEEEIARKKETATAEETPPDPPTEEKPKEDIPFKEIIEYLNERTGKSFKHASKANQKNIAARWNEGHRIDDFKHVIDVKSDEWLGKADMEQYLCPETLFRPSKFEKYLNQKKRTTKHPLGSFERKPQQQPKPMITEEQRLKMLEEAGIQL